MNPCTVNFIESIQEVKAKATAVVKLNSKLKKIKWFTEAIIYSVRERDNLYKQLKKQPYHIVLCQRFFFNRNTINAIIKRAQFNYYKY